MNTEMKLFAQLSTALTSKQVPLIAEALRDIVKNEVSRHPWHNELLEARELMRELRTKVSVTANLQSVDDAKMAIRATLQNLQDALSALDRL